MKNIRNSIHPIVNNFKIRDLPEQLLHHFLAQILMHLQNVLLVTIDASVRTRPAFRRLTSHLQLHVIAHDVSIQAVFPEEFLCN
jgi:hypothetical protein